MKSDMFAGLRRVISKSMREREAQSQKRLTEVRAAIAFLAERKDISGLTFEVLITSNWEGEKNVRKSGKGPLDQFLKRAVDEYLRLNNRSDVQARYAVYVKLGRSKNSQRILIPEEFVRSFFSVGRSPPPQ